MAVQENVLSAVFCVTCEMWVGSLILALLLGFPYLLLLETTLIAHVVISQNTSVNCPGTGPMEHCRVTWGDRCFAPSSPGWAGPVNRAEEAAAAVRSSHSLVGKFLKSDSSETPPPI